MRPLWIGGVTLLADQISKLIIRNTLLPGEIVPVVPGVFRFTHTLNPGAAFGILPDRTLLFVVITVAMLAAALYYLGRERNPNAGMVAGMGLAIGGALGNLVDRLRFGSVVDFLDFRVWPVFNLADVALVVGGLLLAWSTLRPQPGRDGS